jgi:hypothetical protein
VEIPTELDRDECIKTLSLLWNPSSDQFLIIEGTCVQKLREPKIIPITKIIIYFVAAVFDPLVIINTFVVLYKLFQQPLWFHKTGWGVQLPSEILQP